MGVASSKHRFRPATFIFNLCGFAALPFGTGSACPVAIGSGR
jgi:hypothetical protein